MHNLSNLYYAIDDWLFEKRFKVSTFGEVEPYDLKTIDLETLKHAKKYQASRGRVFEKSVQLLLKTTNLKDYYFYDVGSGKSRVLLRSLKYPFSKRIGLEICQNLFQIGQENAAKVDNSIEIYNESALDFNYEDLPSVFYLFNPFDGVILRKWLDEIKKLQAKNYIIYVNPIHSHFIQLSGSFKFIHSKKSFNSNNNIEIYESLSG